MLYRKRSRKSLKSPLGVKVERKMMQRSAQIFVVVGAKDGKVYVIDDGV